MQKSTEWLKLTMDFDAFENKIVGYENLLNDLAKDNSNNEEGFDLALLKSNKTSTEILEFLSGAFTKENNQFLSRYINSSVGQFKIEGANQDLNQVKTEHKKWLSAKSRALTGIRKLVFLSDIIKGEPVDLEERKSMKIHDIQKFILEKLYSVFDEGYYSVKKILSLNGIPLKRPSFDTELIYTLERDGYVEKAVGIGGHIVRISSDGAKYVEELIKARIHLKAEKNRMTEIINDKSQDFKKHLMQLIATDLEKAFDEIDIAIADESELNEDLIMILGRYSRIKKQDRRGIISYEDKRLEENRIAGSLINLIGMIQDRDIK